MGKKLVEWKSSYSTGFDVIDEQHKHLVEMINELYLSFTDGKATDVVQKIIDDMIAYTKYHFTTEENFFKQYDYPATDEHTAQHNSFVDKVADFAIKLKNGELSVSFEVMNFLRDWLIVHIKGDDMKYVEYFKKNQIELS